MKYTPTVGLEIHAELKTKSKMFCDCQNGFGLEDEPNIDICPICMGHPGTLPVANKEAIKKVVKVGLALNGQIPEVARFSRKNYFYPDLTKGYQITAQPDPFVLGGYLSIDGRKIKIDHIHLEEDTGKLIHESPSTSSGQPATLVDYNRAGVPLMELVTEPDISSGVEARKFCEELQLLLRYLNASDADMERGQMRCEVNISVRQLADKKFGTKVEIKNLNSFKVVEKAIDYEIKRQSEILDDGGSVTQETRGWDDNKGATFSQRIKEEAHDYRYFPEPDLPPLHLKEVESEVVKETIELPEARRTRFKKEYKLPEADIEVLTQNKSLGDYFEHVISELKRWKDDENVSDKKAKPRTEMRSVSGTGDELIKLTANYLITELQKLLKINNKELENLKITPENFAEFIVITKKGEISSSGAQAVLAEMFKTGADPSHVIESQDLRQVSDTGEIEKIAQDVISNNPDPVADFKAGKAQAMQFLVGQVMKVSKGKANPSMAREILTKIIK